MPEWISVWVAKIFGSEPVVKVMYVLIGWALLIMFMPANFAASIYERSNIPFSGQLCLFALSFILVDAAHRGLRRWDLRVAASNSKKKKQVEKQEEEGELLKAFNLLDENEKEHLRKFYSLGKNTLWFSTSDHAAMGLSSKGFIDCMHDRQYVNNDYQMTYSVNEKYAAFLKERFSNPETKYL